MAKRQRTSGTGATPLVQNSVEYPTTQRAYTLRLRPVVATGETPEHACERAKHLSDKLWATHEAVNKGAKVFGDWLLSLRGGLSHELAEPPAPAKGKRNEEETIALRKGRRILLALSWLSVEDKLGAPAEPPHVACGGDTDSERQDKVLAAFRSILTARRIGKKEAESWVEDCRDSLSSRIREDAVWVNRSAAFDAAREHIGSSLTREEVWDILEPFFGSREAYFAGVDLAELESAAEEKAKDLVQKAGQWLSSRFGTGTGADFESMSKVYAAMTRWAEGARSFASGPNALKSLAESLARFEPESDDATGILGLISGPGYKSATRNIVKAWEERDAGVSRAELGKFAETASSDMQKAAANVGGKGRRPWSDKLLKQVEDACGFTYLQQDGPARHSEFAVMLDHAARRVSIGHSWIKRAEAERRRFEDEAKRLDNVPAEATAWIDAFVAERSGTSGAVAAGGEYRIRRRAIEGWEEVVKRWKRASCKTEQDRIAAAREVQADPEIEKFGDIQLFEALAVDDAKCVWMQNGKSSTDLLRDYVLGQDARNKQRRFKVPAYRHPDPLRHPVFCDFGNSRWEIKYAAHEAAKTAASKRKPSDADAAWRKDRQGLRMGLWDGNAVSDVDMRWSSKRLTSDLALNNDLPTGVVRIVARADRLGRAASGTAAGEDASVAGLFALDDWNGRLQAPRAQLDAIATRVSKYGWDAKAKKMRDRIKWLVSFSAKLECRGPFVEYTKQFDDNWSARPFVLRKGELAVKHETNDKRQGHAKLILSRLPSLRVLSVDLGHRYAAACVVWETLNAAALKREIAGRATLDGGTDKKHLFLHTRHTDPATNKVRTTIYRRIGTDKLADGTDHPAPWARLDRQFLIKLQGEERPSRKCSPDELCGVQNIEQDLGRVRDQRSPLPVSVDELMAEAVRTLRLALRRLGDAARIAYAFKPDAARQLPGGCSQSHTPESRTQAILEALMRWNDLAHGDRWTDAWAADAWSKQLKLELPTLSENADRWERKRHRAEIEQQLGPIAQQLAESDSSGLHRLWADRWAALDATWRPRLKSVRQWILPRGLRAKQGETRDRASRRRARLGAARHVGGLSLTRITTIRELYQVQKAYAMRPVPDDLRRNVAAKGDDRFDEFGRSVLSTMERLREQRVKQLASRIAAGALGLGGHWKELERRDHKGKVLCDADGKPLIKSVWVEEASPRYPACHAIVIENLRNYRPDELQTRRENRALMNWSSGKVRKYLEEACQLHGLYLREVMPNYTSRQCSRTGLPGIRCVDVAVDSVTGEPTAFWWKKALAGAMNKVGDGEQGDAESRFIVALADHLAALKKDGKPLPPSISVPRNGGDLFIRAAGSAEGTIAALQADLNAAANIGLRALMDPDFAGKWWYVPCDSASGKPAKDKCGGSAYIHLDQALVNPPEKAKGEKLNAWRDIAPEYGSPGSWQPHAEYWARVRARVVAALIRHHGLTKGSTTELVVEPAPW